MIANIILSLKATGLVTLAITDFLTAVVTLYTALGLPILAT